MVGVFYQSRKIPITLPLFITITALSRMIILQRKGSAPENLIYEAGAILIICLSMFNHKAKINIQLFWHK